MCDLNFRYFGFFFSSFVNVSTRQLSLLQTGKDKGYFSMLFFIAYKVISPCIRSRNYCENGKAKTFHFSPLALLNLRFACVCADFLPLSYNV